MTDKEIDMYKPLDFYSEKDRWILKDGHTMLRQDIVTDLNNWRRMSYERGLEIERLNSELDTANKV